jgi:hypothetical protein
MNAGHQCLKDSGMAGGEFMPVDLFHHKPLTMPEFRDVL